MKLAGKPALRGISGSWLVVISRSGCLLVMAPPDPGILYGGLRPGEPSSAQAQTQEKVKRCLAACAGGGGSDQAISPRSYFYFFISTAWRLAA